eukprot:6317466-Pyramimonas_sp.AAC.1
MAGCRGMVPRILAMAGPAAAGPKKEPGAEKATEEALERLRRAQAEVAELQPIPENIGMEMPDATVEMSTE